MAWQATGVTGAARSGASAARWLENTGNSSLWEAGIGPFADGDLVRYDIEARDHDGPASGGGHAVRIGPTLHLALLWHHHQPLYRPEGSQVAWQPWVRLHALRDYYGMAALLAQTPAVHATINFSPVLLAQVEAYASGRAVDRHLNLTLRPQAELTDAEREEILSTFFDADWHHQIYPHRRYTELLTRRLQGRPFGPQHMQDLRMWSNLAWFAREFREADVTLITGEVVRIQRFIAKGHRFSGADVSAMVEEQWKICRAIVPLHRSLHEQVEVSTTPAFHPILPLLHSTDEATLDTPGASLPDPAFAFPDDVVAQVRMAVDEHTRHFGRPPTGMWPAEGAVSSSVLPAIGAAGIQWIASDEGVLARSGEYGYRVEDPAVLARPYRLAESGCDLAVFFRDRRLSDALAFEAQHHPEPARAVKRILTDLKHRYLAEASLEDQIVTVILDGENAWGSHPEDGRPFLQALYQALAGDPDLRTVTLREFLEGDPERGIAAHPCASLSAIHPLYTGSWIDEPGSTDGVDLGTWIGEPEENAAWILLAQARQHLLDMGATPACLPGAYRAIHAAEGSDWFWWLGSDQDSGRDADFEALFREHLASVYRETGSTPPATLGIPLTRRKVAWTFAAPVKEIFTDDGLVVETHCPGDLEWYFDQGIVERCPLFPVGGAHAGTGRHRLTLPPWPATTRQIAFHFRCRHEGCSGTGPCCRPAWQTVRVRSRS